MQKLTKEQAIVLTGFTGVLCCTSFDDFHEDIEKRLGRQVFTHEFGSENFSKVVVKDAYRKDFMDMIPE